jgi:hypothetical protein
VWEALLRLVQILAVGILLLLNLEQHQQKDKGQNFARQSPLAPCARHHLLSSPPPPPPSPPPPAEASTSAPLTASAQGWPSHCWHQFALAALRCCGKRERKSLMCCQTLAGGRM